MEISQASPRRAVLLSLLWGFLLPQVILVVLNLRGWALISGEANQQELSAALALFCLQLAIILVGAVVYWLQRKGEYRIGWKAALASLIAHAGYMWLFVINVENIIPDSIQPWILNEGDVGRWNITLFMPGAFLSLYALSSYFFSSIKGAKSNLIVLFATIGMPVAWYLLVSLMQPAWLGQYAVVGSVMVGTLIVVIFLGAIIRLFDKVIHQPVSTNLVEKHYIIAFLIGLAAPLGGLALNHKIPFPADFQSMGVYVLTVVNGLVLLVKPIESRFAPLKLFLRCITFPFIFYFFLVFLPFLPLSLIAILAVGTGFLMLTPLALGLFQSRITLTEYNFAKVCVGQPKAILISISGLLVLPACFLAQAVLDKNALDYSLEYFYSHDIWGEAPSESAMERSAKTLLQLRDRKSGIQLPYISGLYNTVVFGNLVLSDKKISRMYQLLTNGDLPEERASVFGARGQSGRVLRGGVIAPSQDVKISNVAFSTSATGSSTARLTLQNLSDDTHSLFVDQLHLPEGVFVSGLRLKIDGEWESGRIFDRKTALWVFQKITEVRRDPALLYYLSPTSAELRVYPFPSAGIREVEIDFEYHPGMDSLLKIGDQVIDLNPSLNFPSIVNQAGKDLVGDKLSDLAFQRSPYIHFILDYSKQSKTETKDYVDKIVRVSEELDIPQLRVSAANIAVSKRDKAELLTVADPDSIARYIESIQLPEAGGLWIQQAMAKEILNVDETIDEDNFNRRPVFVVVGGKRSINSGDVLLDAWNWLIPDMTEWYSYTDGQLNKQHVRSDEQSSQENRSELSSVIAIRQGSKISILSADGSSVFESTEGKEIRIFDPLGNRFTAVSVNNLTPLPDLKWVNHAEIWSEWRRINLNPSDLETERSAFLKASREQTLLLPLTSFIVVESPSQWEMLKRKEKQSISNHSGLDFEEEQQTPEPPWWLLLAGLLVFLYFRERKAIALSQAGP
jgi:hypothetical protein